MVSQAFTFVRGKYMDANRFWQRQIGPGQVVADVGRREWLFAHKHRAGLGIVNTSPLQAGRTSRYPDAWERGPKIRTNQTRRPKRVRCSTGINALITDLPNARSTLERYPVRAGSREQCWRPEKNLSGGQDIVDYSALTDGATPRRRNPILWLVVCGILLIAAIAGGTAMMVSNFRDHAIESSKRELENAVVLLARHFDQQLDDAEVPLVDLIDQIHQAGIASTDDFKRQMSTPEVQLQLAEKVSRVSKVAGINIYDADGTLINSSETAHVPYVTIFDRGLFQSPQVQPERGGAPDRTGT